MKSSDLVKDYLQRAESRLYAIEVLYDRESYADVVRESQEALELCLKALLRHCDITVPRIHDVSKILRAEKQKLPEKLQGKVDAIADLSHSLRRDRELAFYGTEDLTPSGFYEKKDAEYAFSQVKEIVRLVLQTIKL